MVARSSTSDPVRVAEAQVVNPVPARRRRIAGYMAVVWGVFGTLFGLIGAGTFVPFAEMMGEAYRDLAWPMTAISVAGLALSLVGVVGGWGLLRGRPWARRLTWEVGLVLIGLVALMGALYPVGLFLLVFVAPLWGGAAWLAWSSSAADGRSPRTASAAL